MNHSWVLIPLLGLVDSLSLILSGLLAYTIRTSSFFAVDPYLLQSEHYWVLMLIAILVWHILLAWGGGYRNLPLLFRIDEMLLQFKTSILVVVLLASFSFLYHRYIYSRLILLFGWLLFVIFGAFGRQLYHRLKESLFRRGIGRRRMLLFGNSSKRDLVEKRIKENPALGVDLVALAADDTPVSILKQEWVDEVFLFNDQIQYENIWELRETSKNPNLMIHLVPMFGNLYLRNIAGGFFDGMVMVSLASPGYSKCAQFLKRLVDIIVSSTFLAIFSPIFLMVGVIIKLDSKGPIIFSQNRIGWLGVPFKIYKFRTMYEDANPYSLTPITRKDPRITRIGSFLRATGLDEIPQLWNVFCGDMSLVGPRPEMPFIVEKYTELEAKRLKVRPGITGLWQVYARTSLLPIHSHIEFDLFYIENFSLALDIMILLDTIPTMLMRTGI